MKRMALAASLKLKDRFEGSLVGALVGDCLGAPFEECFDGYPQGQFSKEDVLEYIDESEKEGVDLKFTDDTQMSQEIADSLIGNSGFAAKDLAKRFVKRYYKDGLTVPYGGNIVTVFEKLRESKYADPFLPAKEQFNGSGSFGNGAAMRIAPVALFTANNVKAAVELVLQTATITHTHEEATHGAIFLCLAIRRCLIDPVTTADEFLQGFKTDLDEVDISTKYREKLKVIEALLGQKNVEGSDVVEKLGNCVSAIRSVPTALFCFLHGLSPIPGFHATDPFRRVMEFSITLGGDADTIASMAGAVAGANFGLSGINKGTWKSCQQVDRVIKQADDIYDMLIQKL